MTLEDLHNKKIVMIGFEATNRSLFYVLRDKFPSLNIAISDANTQIQLPNDPNITTYLGANYLHNLHEYDVIIRSPGVRYWPEIEHLKDRVVTATELFFNEVRANAKAKIIGVTGTKGKSTTSSILYELLKATKKSAFLVGNIDNQDWDIYKNITDDSWIVYELSSYMLEDFKAWPDIAIMLNLFPDHIDWHGDFNKYANAKANITRRQQEEDLFIFNANSDELAIIADHTRAFKVPINIDKGFHLDHDDFYYNHELIISGSVIRLLGRHNRENILHVLAVAKVLNIPYSVVENVLRKFTGLPHRLELVTTKKGIIFYDDAISTTPESTIAALQAMNKLVGTIILGGQDRGYNYSKLANLITKLQIHSVALLPGARNKILHELTKAGYEGETIEVSSMEEAVNVCFDHAPKDTIALLSTAAPSYDMFKNYKDQGNQFKKYVMEF